MTDLQSKDDQDVRLGEAVDGYLTAIANGQRPDIDEYIRQFPEIAELLRLAIPTILATEVTKDTACGSTSVEREKRLGDFRILRQIGRGGMGIVYEAEQVSMARRVALKVLPLAGLVDELKIKRFQNEVRAVAALNHPHIVSVYMVGLEDGVHYYAMQLIRGHDLAQVIHSLRRARAEGVEPRGDSLSQIATGEWTHEVAPADPVTHHNPELGVRETIHVAGDSTVPHETQREYYRNAVTIILQAASAIQHAHEQGIVHRDIKPANLLLDTSANIFVTDFGLARVEADVGVTMTGDLVGTLRYMAPEQALGNPIQIDHRADVYSLAATLYELLVLRPAYGATDKQQLLRQIASDEPIPLRKLDARIPVDLETVVHKAMSKDREERYASTEDFADDLRRFLEHRPIQARPPTLIHTVGKWTRRNPALVWATLVSLLVLSVSLAFGATVINQKRKQAIEARDEMRENLYRSEVNQAFQAWSRGNLMRTKELLARQLPLPSEHDLRGFEWYFLAKQCRRLGSRSLPEANGSISYSADRRLMAGVFASDLLVVNLESFEKRTITADIADGIELGGTAFSPDAKRLAIATSEGTRLIELDTNKSLFIPGASHSPVAFSGDGKWGASFGTDRKVTVWNATTGAIKWSHQSSRTDWIKEVQFSPDSQHLAVVGNTNSIEYWDVHSGEAKTIPARQNPTFGAHFLDNDTLLIGGGGARGATLVPLNDAPDRRSIWLPPTKYILSIDVSPDGRRIALGTESKALEIWDLERQVLVWRRLCRRRASDVAFVGSGDQIAYSSDGVFEVLDIKDTSTQVLDVATFYNWHNCVAVAGSTVVAAGKAGEIVAWEPASRSTKMVRFRVDTNDENWVYSVAISPDAKQVAITRRGDAFVHLCDIGKRKETHRFDTGTGSFLGFSAVGGLLVSGSQGMSAWDTKTGEIRWTTPARQQIFTIRFTTDGLRMITGGGNWNESGRLTVWDVTGAQPKLERDFAHEEKVLCVAISANNRWLVAGDGSGQVVVYDLETLKEITRVNAHAMAVQSIAFSPDQQTVLTGSYDGSLRFWQVGTWAECGELVQANAVQGLGFVEMGNDVGLLIGTRESSDSPAQQQIQSIPIQGDWQWLHD